MALVGGSIAPYYYYDCNGTADDGCPTSISFGTPSVTRYVGGDGGSPDARSCPDGYAMVGVKLTGHSPWYVTATVIDSLRIVCRPLDLVVANGDEYEYDIEVNLGSVRQSSALGTAGSTSNPRSLLCDSGEVVYGMKTKTGWYVDTLQLRCGRLGVSGQPGAFSVTRNAAGDTAYAYVAAPDTTTTCASSKIATGVSVRDGSLIDAIAPQCTTANLNLAY